VTPIWLFAGVVILFAMNYALEEIAKQLKRVADALEAEQPAEGGKEK
jgi:hypothetical protein